MITIQQKLFRLLKIFSPAMQDQKLASPVVASLQGEEQLVAAVLRPSHRVQAGSVFRADKVHWNGRLSHSSLSWSPPPPCQVGQVQLPNLELCSLPPPLTLQRLVGACAMCRSGERSPQGPATSCPPSRPPRLLNLFTKGPGCGSGSPARRRVAPWNLTS